MTWESPDNCSGVDVYHLHCEVLHSKGQQSALPLKPQTPNITFQQEFLEQSTSLELPELDNTLTVHCDGLPVQSTGGDTSDRVLMRRPLSMLVAAAM